jgi:hypothetical protein
MLSLLRVRFFPVSGLANGLRCAPAHTPIFCCLMSTVSIMPGMEAQQSLRRDLPRAFQQT